MDKMKFETPDMTAGNVEKIAELFPNCVTEMRDENGKVKRGINFEVLKQMLSSDVVDGDECYEFTWVGKKASIAEANRPIRKTLRPCPEESKDWDTTENLYIEGDNLEVLKLLQESYLGKVKMIYIDPPYNTGNDFIYADDFMRSQEEENEQMGMYDEEDNRLFKNTDSNGRFHSDWCSMMYPRLLLARNLLADDGVIFISIDDNEQENLKKICDEVFGESNFVNVFMWLHGKGKKNAHSRTLQQYVLCYAKCLSQVKEWTDYDYTSYEFTNPDNDPKGKWFSGSLSFNENRSNPLHPNYYTITSPSGVKWTRQWQVNYDEMQKLIEEGDISWGTSPKFDSVPRQKIRPSKIEIIPPNIFENCGTTAGAEKELGDIVGKDIFSYPKPVALLKHIIILSCDQNAIILDFFSGSATTAHAVMQLNAEDNGHRKFIMVQLPETCDEQSEAYKAGYKTICEIGKERIRRAGEKILQEKAHLTNAVQSGAFQKGEAYAEFTSSQKAIATQDKIKQTLDVGFRVLKLADSNMKDVYYAADDYKQADLLDMVSNIKDDRTDLDLLFGCLIDWGLPLSMPYTSEKLEGCTVHTYNDGDLIACFDNNIPESVIREIAKRKPLRAVFRDSGFADSPSKINVFEIFKLYMPEDADDISKRVRVI